jgi:MYXO-CTERM domain-containing protein
MSLKASLLSTGLLAAVLLVSAEADATNSHFRRKVPKAPAPRAIPELNVQHAGVPAALLLAGVALIAGRRRKTQA